VSAPIALPAPRVFRLPRVRFKRPRWPRGSRFCLAMLLFSVFATVNDMVGGARLYAGGQTALGCVWLRWWWRSRDDDDGPSAT
jgi:hypothetical protein